VGDEQMEKLFGKILIATDASENNKPAVEEGLRIARSCGSIVHAVYVIDNRALDTVSADVPVRNTTYQVIRDEAGKAVDKVLSHAGDVTVETAILEGQPSTEIVKYAAEKQIDLIVIGTRGKRGIERLLLGSVAENVIRSAECKVLVVK
jgi:nucleotide-binding universal stress UspA family protein